MLAYNNHRSHLSLLVSETVGDVLLVLTVQAGVNAHSDVISTLLYDVALSVLWMQTVVSMM
jgi:hypothetical protein